MGCCGISLTTPFFFCAKILKARTARDSSPQTPPPAPSEHRIEPATHCLNTWRVEPQKEKSPFHFRKNPPPQIRKARDIFSFWGCREKRGGGGAFVERTILVRATMRSARAISQGYFQNKFEFCTIDTAIFRKGFPYYLCKNFNSQLRCKLLKKGFGTSSGKTRHFVTGQTTLTKECTWSGK